MSEGEDQPRTVDYRPHGAASRSVRRFRLVGTGAAEGLDWESTSDRCSIGSHPSNDVRIDEDTVSRFHCEIAALPDGVTVRDLGSRNGTILDGALIREGFLRHGSTLRLGKAQLRFDLERAHNPLPESDRPELGRLVGTSAPMRTIFARLTRAAESDITVLLEGETGSGKGAAAEAIHLTSARASGPFVVVDCGALPPTLLESELFGHERGAFTGATQRRAGAFEEADGGTLFLDEIGELGADLQPKLLRALEDRTIRRLGGTGARRVNVRLVAATNRDLRLEVNEKRFRPDLYFRLAVARIALPALRDRPGDVPLLVERLLDGLNAPAAVRAMLLSPEMVAQLQHNPWPGNVRELRNFVERFVVFGEEVGAPGSAPAAEPGGPAGREPFVEARRRALAGFERGYLADLVAEFGTRTVQAAEAAGLDRVYLYRLLRRYGLR